MIQYVLMSKAHLKYLIIFFNCSVLFDITFIISLLTKLQLHHYRSVITIHDIQEMTIKYIFVDA